MARTRRRAFRDVRRGRPERDCLDGGNIWVANYLADTVTKLRASDPQVPDDQRPADDFLTGEMHRISWADLEPSPGDFDFTKIDELLGTATTQGTLPPWTVAFAQPVQGTRLH